MKTLVALSITIAASLPISACAPHRTPAELRPGSTEGMVYVHVTNHYHGPVEIHASGSGMSYRIGTVLPGFSSRFALRPIMTASGPVELLARSGNGSPMVRSGRLLLTPGDVVDFRIATHVLTSDATVRP